MQIKTIGLTLKNEIFKENSFINFETTIRFVALKLVQELSRILIPNLSCLCMENETKSNCQFHKLSQKT